MASLADAYDGFVLDLDGVVYRGAQPIPGAADTVAALRERGKALVFLTNNSARTPSQVAGRLSHMGIAADPHEVVTSAHAATALAVAGGAKRAYVVGEEGVREALAEAGIEVVAGEPDDADVVMVGWDPHVTYEKLRRASVLVQRGARLLATNADASYPAPGGELWPGAGALLAVVETTTGVRAEVAGKPYPRLFEEAVARAGADKVLVVGDRVETDVEGAARAGLDAALVLTGAASPADLIDAAVLPVAVLGDLPGLLQERPVVKVRRAEPRDAEAVRSLVAEAGLDDAGAGRGVTVVAASEGGEVLATAGVDLRGREGYLRSVAVRRGARRFHLGTLVVAAVAGEAARAGAERLFLLTEEAKGFFRGLGFQSVGRGRVPRWVLEGAGRTCSESATAMWRPVRPGGTSGS